MLRFSILTEADIGQAADWVERLEAREHVANPQAMLEHLLRKRAALAEAELASPTHTPRRTAEARPLPKLDDTVHADPDVAARELAKIRELLGMRDLSA